MSSNVKTKEEHILYCIGEESGEIQQVLGKIGRFGMLDMNPTTNVNNFMHLMYEMHDIIAVWEMLCDEIGEDSEISRRLIDKKKNRVEKYMRYARKRGVLEDDK